MVTDQLLARARAGDPAAFAELTERYRGELQVHCYRIVGRLTDAEDLVQDTLLAAWRAMPGFEGRASVRTWLYRIATNRCLNALRDRDRRPGTVPARFDQAGLPEPTRVADVTWLEPYPDALLEQLADPAGEPYARVERRESISLAFITAVQTLPPRQRAILVLRDVLAFRVAEVATLLGTTQDAVASGLKRARAKVQGGRRADPPPLPGSSTEQRVVAAFVTAFENGDIPALVELLTADAWLTMPPLPLEYQGRAAFGTFFRELGFQHGRRSFRLVPTRANGQPAFGRYERDPRARLAHAHGLTVLSLAGGAITQLTSFLDTGLLARFGLPRTLPD